jgi:hypothetical protein
MAASSNQTDVFFIDKNGALNVAWVVGAGQWAGPQLISNAGAAPAGGAVTSSAQFGGLPNQTDVFFVDSSGRLNVAWVVGVGQWAGPQAISAAVAVPGSPVAASAQFGLPNQTDVFFIDKNGALNVAWVVGAGQWAGPQLISNAGAAPAGSPVAASAQFGLPNQTDVFFVDSSGRLNVAWVVGAGQWAGPQAISGPVAVPGSPVAASAQFGLPNQTDVFFVDRYGALNVAWVVGGGQWAGPQPISKRVAVPGSPVAASAQFGMDNQTDVFFLDSSGRLNVAWVIGAGQWAGPQAISGPVARPNSPVPVAASAQFGVDNQTDVFFLDSSGALNVAWVVGGGQWAGPQAISAMQIAGALTAVNASQQYALPGQPVITGNVAAFDSGQLPSDLPLGGSAHVVFNDKGDFTFSCFAHDSGFDNITYVVSAVILTPEGIAFTFQHSGNVEGTIQSVVSFRSPHRDDSFTNGGNNVEITNEWSNMPGSFMVASIDGTDATLQGLANALGQVLQNAADELGRDIVKKIVLKGV